MAKVTMPAKNDLFTVLLVVSALIFLCGLVMNSTKLKAYKGGTKVEPVRLRDLPTPEASAPAHEATESDEEAAPAATEDEADDDAAVDADAVDADADEGEDAGAADEADDAAADDDAGADEADDAGADEAPAEDAGE